MKFAQYQKVTKKIKEFMNTSPLMRPLYLLTRPDERAIRVACLYSYPNIKPDKGSWLTGLLTGGTWHFFLKERVNKAFSDLFSKNENLRKPALELGQQMIWGVGEAAKKLAPIINNEAGKIAQAIPRFI